MGIFDSDLKSVAFGAGGAVLGGTLGYIAGRASKRKKRKRTTKAKNRKKRTYHRKGRYRKTPHTAGKRRDRSMRRIRYTSNGQPYVLMKSGKARFIKKSSAKRSHRTSGGRY